VTQGLVEDMDEDDLGAYRPLARREAGSRS